MKIRSRKSWGARPPRPRSRQHPTNVSEFFIHWPGNNRDNFLAEAQEKAKLREWQDFHMNGRGWSDIGYNFAVFSSGRIYRLRGMDWVPAAQEFHNTNTVSCVCVGMVTGAMKASIIDLKNHCDRRAKRDLTARPHSAVTATDCPGDELRALVPVLNREA